MHRDCGGRVTARGHQRYVRGVNEQPNASRSDFDAASSEALHPAARGVLHAALEQGYADPRRLHHEGRRARLLLENAREVVAQTLDLRPNEVSFTTSGTDAVHRGLLGLHRGRARAGRSIVHSAVEHSSVLHAARWTEAPTIEVPVTMTGTVSVEALRESTARADAPVAVAAVQSANHEVGTVQDTEALAETLQDIPLFVDACASLGRTPLPQGWAAAAGSAHKWGGPAGIGLLLVNLWDGAPDQATMNLLVWVVMSVVSVWLLEAAL